MLESTSSPPSAAGASADEAGTRTMLRDLFLLLPDRDVRDVIADIDGKAHLDLPGDGASPAELAAQAADIVKRHHGVEQVLPALDRRLHSHRATLARLARAVGVVLPPPRVLLMYAPDSGAEAIELAARMRREGVDGIPDRGDLESEPARMAWLEGELGRMDAGVVLLGDAMRRCLDDGVDVGLGPVGPRLRSLADVQTVRWIPVVAPSAERTAVPRMFAERTVYVLPRDLEALFDDLLVARARNPLPPLDTVPLVRPVARAFAVVCSPLDHTGVRDVAGQLGVVVEPAEDPRHALEASVVVFVGSQIPPALERVRAATDRDLLVVDGDAALRDVADRAVRLHRDRMQAWWRGAGVEWMLGALAAAAAPSIAALVWGPPGPRPWLWTAVWLLGSGLVFNAGVLVGTRSAALTLRGVSGWREAWRLFDVFLEYALLGTDLRARARRLAVLGLGFLGLWLVFFGATLFLTSEQRAPVLVMGAGAVGLGALSVSVVARARTRRTVAAVLTASLTLIGANVLTQLGVHWEERGQPWSDLLPTLLEVPADYSPTIWLLAGPGLAPLCLGAASLAAFACTWPRPGLRANRPVQRILGLALLGLAVVVGWLTGQR